MQLIHSDVWGPAPTKSECGFKYYVLFIDDFTRYTWVFPIINKSDVFDTFRLFKLQIENLVSLRIKSFCSDGGGEYMSKRFQSLLAESGILHQVSYPFTPEQNGCAERKHGHVIETGLTFLFNAHMPTGLHQLTNRNQVSCSFNYSVAVSSTSPSTASTQSSLRQQPLPFPILQDHTVTEPHSPDPAPSPLLLSSNSHPMVTRSKDGISKKVFFLH